MICCTPQLADEKACKLGQVIIRRNPDNPKWPRCITTSFAGRNQETKMDSVTVEIDKTGMYYLYFMFCDPHLKGTIIKGRTVWRNPTMFSAGDAIKAKRNSDSSLLPLSFINSNQCVLRFFEGKSKPTS
ncbi:hypothetical protein EUGRSUZ_A00768 [Eucalyptus grandis]|uniref:Uncharacterized protein n=2 Tax=Eucalyptus grandis TaxID=71139 RepID=A0ACC3M0W6_EUCGR|nr:hypothetical protein EUGRSUZ_A00768 [Eucalyptus grandis]